MNPLGEPGEEDHSHLKTILVVMQQSDAAARLVQAIGAETPSYPLYAADGRTALELVRRVKPDLLLCDDRLPDMTGVELYDRFHTTTGLEHIPALLLQIQAKASACDSALVSSRTQPFELDHLLHLIQELVADPVVSSPSEGL